jgi:pectinesterase
VITNTEGQKDRIVVKDKDTPPMWARFYHLETARSFFCDRDGIKRKTFAELGYNRRNGYSWYTNAPEEVLVKYLKWAKKANLNSF